MWGTLEAIKISDKKVHFVLIDDSGPLFDCRDPMGNITVTQLYWKIRHELKRYAKQSGRCVGGLVILAIVIQDYMGLDKRIRDALGFTVFKTYDKAIVREKLISDEHIIKLLKKLKYKSAVACDWKYRKFAVGVDAEEKYTLFYCDPDQYPYIPFTNIVGEDIFEKQRDLLVRYLVDNVNLKSTRDYIEGKLYFKIDKMKESDERCRISKEHLSEIIKRAKTIKIDMNKNKGIDNKIFGKRDKAKIIYYRFAENLSYDKMERKYGIPHSTSQRICNEFINDMQESESEELEVNAE